MFTNLLNNCWTGAKFQVLFTLPTSFNYSITNYFKVLVFHFLENMNRGHIKMVNVKYYKWPDLAILLF